PAGAAVPAPAGVGAAATAPPGDVLDFPAPPIAGTPEASAGDGSRVLGRRYRLAEQLAVSNRTQTWRADDLVLGRAVLVHLLDPDDQGTAEVLRLSREAALATDARFLRVLDVVEDEPGVGPYLVYEYAAGQTLEKVLRGGPLTGVESAWIVREVADALIALHAQGHFHRHLSPATVLVTTSGNVKVLGFGVNDAGRPAATATNGEAADVRALGQLLYACLVARWPGGDRFGLPAAPVADSNWVLPSEVRGGVAPAVDRVVDRLLSPVPRGHAPRLATAQDVTTQLSLVLGPMGAAQDLRARLDPDRDAAGSDATPAPVSRVAPPRPTPASVGRFSATSASLPEEDDEPEDSTQPFVAAALERSESFTPVPPPANARPVAADQPAPRRSLRLPVLLGALALVLAVGIVAAVALSVRDPATTPATATGTLSVTKATAFDPKADGGDASESNKSAPLAVDGNPETVWRTEKYRSAALGSRKPGVGLVLDLGETRTVTRVQLTLEGKGTAVALKVPSEPVESAPMKSVERWDSMASVADAGTSTTLVPGQPVQTRYLLVYLTSLPSIGNDYYRGGVAEIVVSGH
ncbi:protein kinase domain-containing protein, partial [Propionicimonas sp.]|uniref:protein kinase family protein n=1 Tax=Propionicimonas sp. TaxID=1955623 RepID=UPI0039E4AD82